MLRGSSSITRSERTLSKKNPHLFISLLAFQCASYKPFDLISYKFMILTSECCIQFVRFMGVYGTDMFLVFIPFVLLGDSFVPMIHRVYSC